MEQGPPGQSHVLDGLDVWRNAHNGHLYPERRRLYAAAVQPAVCRQASGHLAVCDYAGSLPAVPGLGRELAGGGGRRHCRGFLQLQFPDYPGGAQHQDAGHRPVPLGAGGAGVYVQGRWPVETASGRGAFRPHPQFPGEGQPPADYLLPGHRGVPVCPGRTDPYR